MESTTSHIAARDDENLQKRLIAAAEQMGYLNAQQAIISSLGKLVSAPVEIGSDTSNITKVHEYATLKQQEVLTSAAAMPPGLNPSAVTDTILRAAITAVLGPID